MKDINGTELKAGQVCKVHPAIRENGSNSFARSVFFCEIQPYIPNKGDCGFSELITSVPGKHGAWINEYLLSRLEVVGTIKTHGHLLNDQNWNHIVPQLSLPPSKQYLQLTQ